MRSRLKRAVTRLACAAAMVGLFCIGANAYTYSASLPSNVSSLKVTVGGVSMPFTRYPDGSNFPTSKSYMTVEEQKDYGLNIGSDLWLRGSQCVAFARYTYAALFYKYPQDATMDNYLAYQSGPTSIYYKNVIKDTFGSSTLAAGYTAANLKTLISNCQPGAVMRVSGHSMVIMGIFSDGFVVYDANFSNDDEVDVRSYTWQGFVNSLGGRAIEAVQTPAYYPGYTYTYDNKIQEGGGDMYKIDTSSSGTYTVYNCTKLNVRTAPTSAATSVGTIDAGTTVTVQGTHDGWALITYNGADRWVSADYLQSMASQLTVTFDANGGSISTTSVTYQIGTKFGSLPTGTKTDCTLLGWYNGETLYTADSTVPSLNGLTLTARWGVMGFTDVLDDSWYASYVADGVKDGLIMQDKLFNPEQNATRAQFVTVLAREYQRETGGSYDVGVLGSSIFTDLVVNEYYDKPVAWAYYNNITKGIGNNHFGPEDNVKREQIATFLYRYAQSIGAQKGNYTGANLIYNFGDGGQVSDYAVEAMNWAISNGLIQGDGLHNLNPQNPTRRCEMVTMMTRFISYLTSVQTAADEDEESSVVTVERSQELTDADITEPEQESTQAPTAAPESDQETESTQDAESETLPEEAEDSAEPAA